MLSIISKIYKKFESLENWSDEKAKIQETGIKEPLKGYISLITGLAVVYLFFIAFMMQFMVIHEFGAFGMINGAEESALPSYKAFMDDYAGKFRTFSHGALHGTMIGLLFVFPLIGISGLFERKSWKYILIHSGYWIICLAIIGAIVCGWK